MPNSSENDESRPWVSIVVPVFKSADCLEALAAAIEEALTQAGYSYELLLVNDCSPDGSWQIIESLCARADNLIGVDLRKNFGQDNAILTGLRLARGRYVAVMDDDLQHHPRDLPAMLAKADEDFDVVYADFRKKKQKRWKNAGSWFNGKVAEWVIDKPPNVYLSPYKVIRGEVAELVCRYQGPAPYVDGLLFQVTSRITQIPVEHHARFAGSSNYTFWRSVAVWARLALSFSIKPLRIVSLCGFFFAALGLLMAAVVVAYRLLLPEDFPPSAVGWASLMVALLMVGGIQMIFFGILGEYAGRTFMTVSNKPQTAIRRVLNYRHVQTGDHSEALSKR
ncbi:MAG TPA: glycosyltransferase family 2 protein [Blastocatellia bacterium]|nr:glycosyltransferase family 2 protein [Blastocatellia bacterium]